MTIAKHAAIKASKFSGVPTSLQVSVAKTKVDYCRLGKSGLRVSNPILGCLQIGSPEWLPWVLGEEKNVTAKGTTTTQGCLRQRCQHADTLFDCDQWDTANVYSNGESERIIGKALWKYGIPRSKVVLLTKCCRVVCDHESFEVGSGVAVHSVEAARSKDYMNSWGLSRSAIFNAVEASLERLGSTYIDLLQIHRFDEQVPPEETMQALDCLVKAGKVRYIGASSMWTYQLASLQQAADRHGYTKFVAGLIPWAPLASGQLARPWNQNGTSLRSTVNKNGELYHDEDTSASQAIVGRVEEIARRRGWPMSHVALAWLNRRVAAPLVGFSSVERLDEILGARGKLLTPDEEAYLDEPYRPRWVQGHA
ncbi:aryl-alcohol protein [Apiospora phragmitis]|uniref:Aryl-alcohol protein n=1 Tax=Apiospora phragmitis TaxID=2905665 RepID=A0ABR1X7H0_9PEZI